MIGRRLLTSGVAATVLGSAWGTAPARAADATKPLTKLTFIQEWPVADGFWIPWTLGSQKGFYADEGILLNVVAPPTVADTMKFLGTGRADVAFTTVMDIIFAREEEAPVVAVGRYGQGNNWGLFLKQGSTLTVPQLKGKTVAIYNDAWTKAQLSLMLQSSGLTLDDLTMVAAADDTVPLLLQNKADAITGITNAEGSELVSGGIADPKFIPAVDFGVPNTPIFMLAANEPFLKDHPDLVKGFLKATQRSIEYAATHPKEATDSFAGVYAKAYDPVFITQQWKDTIAQFDVGKANLMTLSDQNWAVLLTAVRKLGLIKTNNVASTYYTNAYLPVGG